MKQKNSFVIPVLDFSPNSHYNIRTLLTDLEAIDGEVICIFNSHEVFRELRDHDRIDKYTYNNLNAGVSRSWNIGLNMAEGDVVFIMNADLHIQPAAVMKMCRYIKSLEKAVIVGPQGAIVEFRQLRDKHYYGKGSFQKPTRVQAVSGFFFAIHLKRYQEKRLSFDVRYSPCFMEEWDMGLQVIQAGLCSYVVPVTEYEHDWGISGDCGNTVINYFGRNLYRDDILNRNRQRFLDKWFGTDVS